MVKGLDNWFTDDADANEARNLGRSAFVDVVKMGIEACEARKSSTVFSLVGAWGSGKSSLIEALVSELDSSSRGWGIVRFNPWVFQDLPSLQLGFFAELREVFPSETKGTKVREKLSDLAEAVAPLASATTLVGVDGSVVVAGLAKLVGGDRSVTASYQQLEKLLGKRSSPVLVVMDDLDRLAPDELLLTLKLVRLIGRLPYVHYLLAYDEDTLLDVLSRTGLVGESRSRARDYLEKVVQVRFDIPAVRPDDVTAKTNAALGRVLSEVQIEMTDGQAERFSRAYFGHIQRRLDTPRAISRYWAQVRLSLTDLRGELDVADFLIITWLRTAEPGAYRLIQERREQILGSGSFSNVSAEEKGASQADLRAALEQSGTRPAHVREVASLIGRIFPNFRAIWDAKPPVNPEPIGQRICHPDYFDRYFSLGVPAGDIPDSTVRVALAQMDQDDPGPEVIELANILQKSPDLVLGKLKILAGGTRPAPLFLWLAENYSNVPLDARTTFFSSSERVVDLARDLLVRVHPDEVTNLVDAALQRTDGIPLVVQAAAQASRVREDDVPGTSRIALDAASRAMIGKRFGAAYDALDVVDPFAIEPDVWTSIWAWAEIDRPSLKTWLDARLTVWGPLDMMARFVSQSHLIGGGPNAARLGEINFNSVSKFLDIDAISNSLSEQIDKAESPGRSRSLADTPENRRRIALSQLRSRHRTRESNAEVRTAD